MEQQKDKINILPFLIEAFSTKRTIRKDIDMLYETDKYRFYKKAKESEWYNNPIVKEGDIYREVYAGVCQDSCRINFYFHTCFLNLPFTLIPNLYEYHLHDDLISIANPLIRAAI